MVSHSRIAAGQRQRLSLQIHRARCGASDRSANNRVAAMIVRSARNVERTRPLQSPLADKAGGGGLGAGWETVSADFSCSLLRAPCSPLMSKVPRADWV